MGKNIFLFLKSWNMFFFLLKTVSILIYPHALCSRRNCTQNIRKMGKYLHSLSHFSLSLFLPLSLFLSLLSLSLSLPSFIICSLFLSLFLVLFFCYLTFYFLFSFLLFLSSLLYFPSFSLPSLSLSFCSWKGVFTRFN